MEELKISSSSFDYGEWIPNRNSGYGEDESPELHVEGIAEETVSMVIMLDDAGHPLFPNYNHWIAWNLPSVNVIPKNLPHGAVVESPFHIEQGVAYGKHRYRGPKPPFNWLHEYRFTVYTLDTKLAIGEGSNKKAVLQAMEGHILQTAILMGKYRRRHKF